MDFNSLAGKAGELLGEHGDKVATVVDKAGDLAKEKLGHDEQVDMAVDKVKGMLPGDQVDEDGEASPEPPPA